VRTSCVCAMAMTAWSCASYDALTVSVHAVGGRPTAWDPGYPFAALPAAGTRLPRWHRRPDGAAGPSDTQWDRLALVAGDAPLKGQSFVRDLRGSLRVAAIFGGSIALRLLAAGAGSVRLPVPPTRL
jgi:hypothetical protein